MRYFVRAWNFRVPLASFVVGFGVSACSPSTPPPKLNQADIPTQGCIGVSMDVRAMKPQHVRSLLTCLNSDGRLAPLVNYVNDLSDSEMQPLLDLYNLSIGGAGNRLDQNIALFERARSAELLKPFFKNLAVMIDSDILQTLGSSILSEVQPTERENIRSGLLAVAQKKQLDGLLILGSQLSASNRAQLVANLISTASSDPASRRAMSIQIAQLLHTMIVNGETKRLLQTFEDPGITTMLKSNPDQAADLTQFAAWLSENPSVVELRAGRLSRLVRFLDRPMKCFVDGNQGTSTDIPNVLNFYMAENSRAVHSGESLEYADQAKLRIMLSLAMSKCQLTESEKAQLQEGLDELNDIAQAGVASGKSLMCSKFYDFNRMTELKTLVASSSFIPALTILSHANGVGALEPMLNLVLADIPDSAWAPGQASLKIFREANGLDGVLSWLSRWTDVNRDSEAQLDSTSYGQFVLALMKDWGSKDGGFGGLIQSAAQISSQSQVAPIQESLVAGLSNRSVFEKAWDAAGVALKKKTATAGLHTLAEMARDGRLTSLINFLIEFEKSGGSLPDMGGRTTLGPVTSYTWLPVRNFQQSKDTQKYLACEKVSGPLFDPKDVNGQHILDAATCLNANQDFPAVLRAAQTLSQDGKLVQFRNVLSDGLLNPTYIPGAKEELGSALKSGLLHDTLDFLRIGDRAKIFPRVEDALSQVFSNKDWREAPLQCMSALLKDPSGPYGMSKFLEVAAASNEAPYLNMRHGYVMKLGMQEPGVRDQAWRLAQDSMSKAEFEKQFARAKSEFEARSYDSTYYNRVALYPKYSDDQLVQNFQQLGKDLLRDRNLEEMILALQDLSDWNETGKLNIVKFLEGAVGTYRGIVYHNPDGKSEVRIASIMDQMEILVRGTDVSMAKAIPYVGIGHMSTFYEVKVAESDNLVPTLEMLSLAAKAGSAYTTLFETEKHFTLQNAVDNFYVLVDYARTGELKLFQRIYQALYRSMPEAHRHDYDKFSNDIALIHHPMDEQFFGRLEPVLQQLREQGKLKEVVDSVFHLAKIVRPEDFPKIRELVDLVVNKRIAPNGPTYLEYILNDLKYENSVAPAEFSKIVAQFYESLPVADRMIEHGGPFIGAIVEMIKSPALYKRVVDATFTDILNPGSVLQNTTSHFMKMSRGDQQVMQHIVGQLTDPNAIPLDALPKVGALVAQTYEAKTESINAILNIWPLWRNTGYGQKLSWTDLGQRWLRVPTAPAPGVKAMTIHLLDDANTRGTLIEISADLANRKALAPMIHDILNGQHLEEAIRLLTDGFQFSGKGSPPAALAH
jgi:hypothetical protein